MAVAIGLVRNPKRAATVYRAPANRRLAKSGPADTLAANPAVRNAPTPTPPFRLRPAVKQPAHIAANCGDRRGGAPRSRHRRLSRRRAGRLARLRRSRRRRQFRSIHAIEFALLILTPRILKLRERAAPREPIRTNRKARSMNVTANPVNPAVSHDLMANAIRVLAMDAVEKAKSGHPGMPMGMADIATVLFTGS